MNKPRSFEEVQTYLTQLENRISRLESQDIDLHGRKIVNAGAAANNTDYATLADVKNEISSQQTSPSSDNGVFSVITVATAYIRKWLRLDPGTVSPVTSPLNIQAGGTGGIDLLTFGTGNNQILLDLQWLNSVLIAKHAVVARIYKNTTGIVIQMSSGNSVGSAASAPSTVFEITPTQMGFWGSAVATKQTLNAYTTNNQSFVYSATPASLVFAATLSDLNFLRAAYENLRLSYDDLRSKLKVTTLVG